jgi:hypothetical protein
MRRLVIMGVSESVQNQCWKHSQTIADVSHETETLVALGQVAIRLRPAGSYRERMVGPASFAKRRAFIPDGTVNC